MTNLAQDIVKMAKNNRKPSASSRKAGAKINVVDIVSEEKRLDLSERETWAVKRFFSIEKTQNKQLGELAQIGQVILDIRGMYTEDKVFKEEVEKREIGKIPYNGSYGRYILMELAKFWDKIEPKVKAGETGYTSRNPESLVKKIKVDLGITKKRKPKTPEKPKSSEEKTPAKSTTTKAQLLQMIQLGLDNGVITEADIKSMKKTVTK